MTDIVWKRTLDEAYFICDTKATLRDTARVFGVSPTTVQRDMTVNLPLVNPVLVLGVREVLSYNKAEASIRGGEAMRQKRWTEVEA